MISLTYIESVLIQELIACLLLILTAIGLYFSIRYVRVSPLMPWLVLAFVGFLGTGLAGRVFNFAVRNSILNDEFANGLSVVTALVQLASWGALVFGLGFVLRDVRERFHLLREAEERTLEEQWLKDDEAYRASQRPPVRTSDR